jgi:hypothetical protein
MVDKLIKGVKGTANSPRETIESLESLSSEEKERRAGSMSKQNSEGFRSLTALALYLSERTRPDILHAVNKLCRNAQNPSIGDGVALNRLQRYLSHTRNAVMKLPATSLKVEAHIDASFATDAVDRKSTTGAVIMLSGAVIWAKSGKQSIVTKPSFEAELVALSDMASMVLWVSLFLQDLGYAIDTPIIYQDNQSAIKVAEKGILNNAKTKHIAMRYLWIKQALDQKKLALVYLPTDKMVADGMTKPLIGEFFYQFVKALNMTQSGRDEARNP